MLSTSNLALNQGIEASLNALHSRGKACPDEVLELCSLLEHSIATAVDSSVDMWQHLLQLLTTLLYQPNASIYGLDRGHEWQPVFMLEDWLLEEWQARKSCGRVDV
jgi:hypothetical protein